MKYPLFACCKHELISSRSCIVISAMKYPTFACCKHELIRSRSFIVQVPAFERAYELLPAAATPLKELKSTPTSSKQQDRAAETMENREAKSKEAFEKKKKNIRGVFTTLGVIKQQVLTRVEQLVHCTEWAHVHGRLFGTDTSWGTHCGPSSCRWSKSCKCCSSSHEQKRARCA